MSTSVKLRDYQKEFVDSVFTAWKEGIRRPAAVLPTGAGKTASFSALIDRFVSENPGQRVVVLVHRDELADQTLSSLKNWAPRLSTGKVKAGSDQVHAQVMVCSVQTLARERRRERLGQAQRLAGQVGLIVTDECHLAAAPSYKKIYEAFPDALNLGVTATLARGDGRGLGSVWDDVVYKKSLPEMISGGYLVRPRGVTVKVDDLELSGIKKTGGDYQTGDLGEAIEHSSLARTVTSAYKEHASDRPGVVFTPTVATAHQMADELNRARIRTAVISGETPGEERRQIYANFKSGKIQVLSNCMVLTTGFDAPWTSCVVMARPTQSQTLFVQCVGRGLRLWPGKKDCLVLDVVGATASNKLKTLIDLDPDLFEQKGPCEECGRTPCVCPCPECGEPKPCLCPKEERPEAQAKGTGGSVDLFAASTQAWLQTKAGVLFIPVGDGVVFLWESKESGSWDVAYAPKQGPWKRLHESLPLGSAMAWAETEADACMPFSTKKTASWRTKKATEAQLGTCARFGIPVGPEMRAGEVGDAMSVFFASKQLDRYLRKG